MKTATHFKAIKYKEKEGFFITLYRFRGLPKHGQTECKCTPELNARNSICFYCVSEKAGEKLQYLGPLGWRFHRQQMDKDILPLLYPIEKLEEITGDNIEKNTNTGLNLYAGL